MFLVCHFKVKMTTEVLKRISIRDRWDRFVVYEKLRLIIIIIIIIRIIPFLLLV